MSRALKIKISGPWGSGKSTLAKMVQETLTRHGIRSKITGCEDEVPWVLTKNWRKRIQNLKGKHVDIETANAAEGSAAPKLAIQDVRLFDLVRYARSYLHESELITDEEYTWLCSDAPLARSAEGGSPSPRRLEAYDAVRTRLTRMEDLVRQHGLLPEGYDEPEVEGVVADLGTP